MVSRPKLSPDLIPQPFDHLVGWRNEDHLAAFNCFRLSAGRMEKKPYTTKSLGISAPDLAVIAASSRNMQVTNGEQAKRFFEDNFVPHRFDVPPYQGLLTGYFEPELSASRVPTDQFRYPLYRRPDDLIDIDDLNRPAQMDRSYAFGRHSPTGIKEYFDRRQIQNGALQGQGLELFWLADPVDVFFVHIQGSAHLTLEDGPRIRVSYAAKSGHPYSAIGKILVDRGDLKLEEVTMQSIRAWIKDNPAERDDLLAANRSYIFFQITDQPQPELGPVAAAGVPLTAGRSLAIDRNLHTFGSPFWVETKENFVANQHPLTRLVIAQDTGSAIVGTQRGDLFIGSGTEAGMFAGQIKHAASMTVFVPKLDRAR